MIPTLLADGEPHTYAVNTSYKIDQVRVQMKKKKRTTDAAANFDPRKVALAVAAISLLAIPFAFVQEELMGQLSQTWVLVFSLAILLSVGVAGYLLVFRHLSASVRRDPYLYFFLISRSQRLQTC